MGAPEEVDHQEHPEDGEADHPYLPHQLAVFVHVSPYSVAAMMPSGPMPCGLFGGLSDSRPETTRTSLRSCPTHLGALMIGLAVTMIRLTFKMMFAMVDGCVLLCTLGKVDPRTRRAF